jgi:hypothetical protein
MARIWAAVIGPAAVVVDVELDEVVVLEVLGLPPEQLARRHAMAMQHVTITAPDTT